MRTMQAIVLSKPGPVENLVLEEPPVPEIKPGWVRIRVGAFGVNESEVTTRKGLSSPDVTLPRIPGIECVGEIDEAPGDSGLKPGQKVATMMGGMGRSLDGSYAEYVVVPVGQVIPFETGLSWDVVGALPEMFQTAYGSLTTGLDLKAGQTPLIRGGTSTVGLSAATIAKAMGATVISTTRNSERTDMLHKLGLDHPRERTIFMTPEEIQTLVDFEQQIQWRWSSGDPTGYMDALAENVTYIDPLAEHFLVGREAVREHFKRIHGDAGITRQEYHNEIARPLSEDEVLLVFGFTTYQQDDNGEEKLFLSWNMSLIFRKIDGEWLMTHGHLSLRNAWDPDSIPKLRDAWNRDSLRK